MHYLLYNNPKLRWILASDALIYIPIELLLEKMPRCIHPNRLYSAKVITFPIMHLSQICSNVNILGLSAIFLRVL